MRRPGSRADAFTETRTCRCESREAEPAAGTVRGGSTEGGAGAWEGVRGGADADERGGCDGAAGGPAECDCASGASAAGAGAAAGAVEGATAGGRVDAAREGGGAGVGPGAGRATPAVLGGNGGFCDGVADRSGGGGGGLETARTGGGGGGAFESMCLLLAAWSLEALRPRSSENGSRPALPELFTHTRKRWHSPRAPGVRAPHWGSDPKGPPPSIPRDRRVHVT